MPIIDISSPKLKEISEVLSEIGLSQAEQEVYVAIAQLGQTSLSPIAKQAGLATTTTQSIVGRLQKRGLLETTKQKSRQLYTALSGERLAQQLEMQKQHVLGIAPLLASLSGGMSSAKIKIYQNDQMSQIFNEALKAKTKVVYEIVSAYDIQQILGERFHFSKKRVERNIRLKSLRIQNREIKKYSKRTHIKELRESRFLPKELNFACSILVWDNTVGFFTTAGEGVAWTVESPALRTTMLQLFGLLWDISKPMITAVD